MKRLSLIFAAVLAVFACKKIDTGGNDNSPVITLTAKVEGENITLSGRLGRGLDESDVTSVGFFVSEDKNVPEGSAKDFAATIESEFQKKITMDDLGGKYAATFYFKAYAKTSDKTYSGKVKVFSTEKMAVSSVTLNNPVLGLSVGEKVTLTATVKPDNASYPEVTWTSSAPKIASVSDKGEVTGIAKGKCVITAEADGVKGTCNVTVRGACPAGAVDMGTSVFWSKVNLGATEVYEEGDYFPWGSTEPLANGITYKHEDYPSWIGEGYKEGETLRPEHDAARKILGGNWRIPTKEEFEELISACEITLRQTGIYEGGKNLEVLTFKSKSTGKSIEIKCSYGCTIIPYSGWCYGYGFYWTATRGGGKNAYAARLREGDQSVSTDISFTAGRDANNQPITTFLTSFALMIRPVTD